MEVADYIESAQQEEPAFTQGILAGNKIRFTSKGKRVRTADEDSSTKHWLKYQLDSSLDEKNKQCTNVTAKQLQPLVHNIGEQKGKWDELQKHEANKKQSRQKCSKITTTSNCIKWELLLKKPMIKAEEKAKIESIT